jgi:hypothetical protein
MSELASYVEGAFLLIDSTVGTRLCVGPGPDLQVRRALVVPTSVKHALCTFLHLLDSDSKQGKSRIPDIIIMWCRTHQGEYSTSAHPLRLSCDACHISIAADAHEPGGLWYRSTVALHQK